MVDQIQLMLQKIEANFNRQQFIKLTLGNKREKLTLLKNVFIKPVKIKSREKKRRREREEERIKKRKRKIKYNRK